MLWAACRVSILLAVERLIQLLLEQTPVNELLVLRFDLLPRRLLLLLLLLLPVWVLIVMSM